METQRTEGKFLAQMSLLRGGKKDFHEVKVRIYPTENIDDPRPFIARDPDGNEVSLKDDELDLAKTLVFRKR